MWASWEGLGLAGGPLYDHVRHKGNLTWLREDIGTTQLLYLARCLRISTSRLAVLNDLMCTAPYLPLDESAVWT